jgi:sterol desaturase/sphingolipid hydroxylase (fatty acid hydroxylase superfamily)
MAALSRRDAGDRREALPAVADEDKHLVKEASVGRLTEERRERVRQKATSEIPWWYSPWGHLAATTGIGLTVLVVSTLQLVRMGTTRWSDWLVLPGVLLVSNFFEWRVHKNVLHRRNRYIPPMQVIYDKHTPMHHMIYVEEDMALRSSKEFRLVLIPAAGVLGIVLTATPIALGLGRLWSAPAGWLFLLTASLYMVTYEVLHLCYHAPSDSFIGRLAFIKVMRAHHAKHHDPRMMQKWNFNVTLPIFDWVMGTMAPRSETSAEARRH